VTRRENTGAAPVLIEIIIEIESIGVMIEIMITMIEEVEDTEEEDGVEAEVAFVEEEVIEESLFHVVEVNLTLPREETSFQKMKKEEEVVEELESTIFTRDSCSNTTDLVRRETKQKMITEGPGLGPEEEKERDTVPVLHPVEVHLPVLTVIENKSERRKRKK